MRPRPTGDGRHVKVDLSGFAANGGRRAMSRRHFPSRDDSKKGLAAPEEICTIP